MASEPLTIFDAEPWWFQDAACTGLGFDLFFEPFATRRAQIICEGCKVRDRCLAYAQHHRLTDGIWGGLTAEERRELRKAA